MIAAGAAAVEVAEVRAATPPDIVVVVLDDMRDSDWVALPETRAWVDANGTWFPNAAMNTPQCVPARAILLTGRYAHSSGVVGNHGSEGGYEQFRRLGLEAETFAPLARAAGYRTALVGKYLNHYSTASGVPVGWDHWLAGGNPDYRNFNLNEDGRGKHYPNSRYLTAVLRDNAARFIRSVPDDQPFLLYLGLKPAHKPASPEQGDSGTHRNAVARKNDAFNEADVSDKPRAVRRKKPLSAKDVRRLDKMERARLDVLVSADRTISAVRQALAASGRLERACVLVPSDNGYQMGEHRLVPKALPYNGSVRFSMAAVGPGFAAGATDRRMTGLVDVAATLADIGGFAMPTAEGRSLVAASPRTAMLAEHHGMGWRSVRTPDEVYTEWDNGEREYYDLAADPNELENGLAGWEGHTPTAHATTRAAVLRPILAALADCRGDACRDADRMPV